MDFVWTKLNCKAAITVMIDVIVDVKNKTNIKVKIIFINFSIKE